MSKVVELFRHKIAGLTQEDLFGPEPAMFNGPVYEPAHDQARLTGQILRVFNLMEDGAWRTLPEIEAATGDPQASISAQLRHLRKPRFGAHVVEKRPRGDRSSGLWEYRLQVNKKTRPAGTRRAK